MLRFGTVARINANGSIDMIDAAGVLLEDVMVIDGARDCPPLGRVAYRTDAPYPIVIGPVGPSREVFHDHFLHVGVLTAPIIARLGDTPWVVPNANTTVTADTNEACGSVNVRADAGGATRVARLQKNSAFAIPDDRAIWLSARVRTDSGLLANATRANEVGFLAASSRLTARVDAVDGWTLLLEVGGLIILQEVEGAQAVSDTWFFVDLVASRHSVALWVDGNGPTVSTVDLADPAAPLGEVVPGLEASYTSSAGPCSVRCDWMHVETFRPGIRPDAIPAAAA